MTAKALEIASDVDRDVQRDQELAGVPEDRRATVAPETVSITLDALKENEEALDFLATM